MKINTRLQGFIWTLETLRGKEGLESSIFMFNWQLDSTRVCVCIEVRNLIKIECKWKKGEIFGHLETKATMQCFEKRQKSNTYRFTEFHPDMRNICLADIISIWSPLVILLANPVWLKIRVFNVKRCKILEGESFRTYDHIRMTEGQFFVRVLWGWKEWCNITEIF